jgi:GT2 family glycosyltransferase
MIPQEMAALYLHALTDARNGRHGGEAEIGLGARPGSEPLIPNGSRGTIISRDVGVVVIGRNEGARLIACLQSVAGRVKDVVYVDSASTDGSVEQAEAIGAHVVRLDMGQRFTAARARNEGFAALKSLAPQIRYVQFVDGDCTLVEDWLAEAVAFIEQHDDVAVVCGRRRERRPAASVYNRLCDIEWNTPIGEASACGGDALVRASAFQAVKGFRADLIAGEEPELCLRLRESGWKIWRLDAEMTRHDAAIVRLGQWWVRAVRFGYAMTEVALLHKSSRMRVFRRETVRAAIWGAGLPIAIGVATLVHPIALLGILIYPLQIFRVALKRGVTTPDSWAYAVFMMLAKFAELQGALRFFWSRWRQHGVRLIEYK